MSGTSEAKPMKPMHTPLHDLLAAVKRTYETLGDAAQRGVRAKPTVAELNDILADLKAAIARAEAR